MPAIVNRHHPAVTISAAHSVRTRRLDLFRANGRWTINGHTWADVVASGFTRNEAEPQRGDTEIRQVRNLSGGWFHPFHIHLVDLRILSRNGRPPFGYERGPKDVVYAGENESVRLLMRFDGGIHAWVMPHHLRQWWPAGAFFAALAASQIFLAALIARRPRPCVLAAAIGSTAGAVGLYVWSRTARLPLLPRLSDVHAHPPEVGRSHAVGGHGNGIPVSPGVRAVLSPSRGPRVSISARVPSARRWRLTALAPEQGRPSRAERL